MSALLQDSKLISRVVSYPTVSSWIEFSKNYYNWGREVSPIVAFAESKLESSLQWITPKVEPILQTETYKKYAQPVLTRVDDLGVSTLESVENRVQNLKTNYNSKKESLGKTVANAKDVTFNALGEVQLKLVVPFDDYLKDSFIGKPLNLALDVTEKVWDRYLPEESEKEEKAGEAVNENHVQNNHAITKTGPVIRATQLSKRAQRQAFAKFNNLSLRPSENLHYTVDLIQYAAQTLDKGVAAVKQTLHKGVESGTLLIQDPKVRQKINTATKDALASLHAAVDSFTKQIPTPITSKIHFVLYSKDANRPDGDEVFIFTSVAQKSSKLLYEVSSVVTEYAARGEQIPKQLVQNTLANLQQVLDNLRSLVKNHTLSVHTNGSVQTADKN